MRGQGPDFSISWFPVAGPVIPLSKWVRELALQVNASPSRAPACTISLCEPLGIYKVKVLSVVERMSQTFITRIRHFPSVQLTQRAKSFVLLTQVSLAPAQLIKIESLLRSGGEPRRIWEIRNTANTSQTQRLPAPWKGQRLGEKPPFPTERCLLRRSKLGSPAPGEIKTAHPA